MTKLTHSLCIFTSALALAAGACSSSNPATTGGGGTSGGSGGRAGEQLINIAATGFAMDTATGITGALYSYGDSVGPNANLSGDDSINSDCVKKGGFMLSQCSHVDAPKPGQPFMADTSGAFCTHGTATVVLMGTNGMYDYSDMWGAGISLDLNNPGGDAGVKMDWNGSNYAGVAFDIAPGADTSLGGIPSTAMRVNFPFTGEHGTDSPYYLGDMRTNSNLPAKGGHVVIHWSDVAGPMYLASQGITAPKFDVTKIQSIQLQVFTNTTTATPYNFCISNLAVLTK